LVATAGIDDNAGDAATKTQLEIFGDGRKLDSTLLEYGKPTPLDVDLSGVLRLKIQWTRTAGSCQERNSYLTLGEAKLLGLPGEVPEPSTTPTN
jgi:serine/threonine-protein kinase